MNVQNLRRNFMLRQGRKAGFGVSKIPVEDVPVYRDNSGKRPVLSEAERIKQEGKGIFEAFLKVISCFCFYLEKPNLPR